MQGESLWLLLEQFSSACDSPTFFCRFAPPPSIIGKMNEWDLVGSVQSGDEERLKPWVRTIFQKNGMPRRFGQLK